MKRIEYFLAVAEEQHFGRAARKLHMSQPPLSHQVRLLEKELGMDLFVRTTRHVELTPAGRELYEGARLAMAQLDHAIASAKRIHGGSAGILRIGFVSTVASRMLSELLHDFREHYGDIELQLFHLTSAQQAAALESGSIDAGFCRTPPGGSVQSRVLVREPLHVAIPSGHALATRKRVPVAALKDQRFVMWDREQTSGIALTVLSLCRKHGFEPAVALEVTNPSAMLGFVADGVGVAIVPASVLLLKPDGVKFLPLDDRATSSIAIAWRPDNRSRLVPHFVEVVTRACERKALQSRAMQPLSASDAKTRPAGAKARVAPRKRARA
jgi:DNA-binding transcriptional LysR family regulator